MYSQCVAGRWAEEAAVGVLKRMWKLWTQRKTAEDSQLWFPVLDLEVGVWLGPS